MSGVGITGLIANLPGTLTRYPTQDPALELGGFRTVANVAERDAIEPQFRVVGMVVVSQFDGTPYQLVGGTSNADWRAILNFEQVSNQYYVIENLEEDAPPFFSTIQAAINACVGSGKSVINTEPGFGYAENLVLPGGVNVNVISPGLGNSGGNTGTITDAPGGGPNRLIMSNFLLTGNVTLTEPGSSFELVCDLPTNSSVIHGSVNINGPFKVDGALQGVPTSTTDPNVVGTSNAVEGDITCTTLQLLNSTIYNPSITLLRTITASSGALLVSTKIQAQNVSFVSPIVTLKDSPLRTSATAALFSGNVRADDLSAGSILAHGATISGTLTLLNEAFTKGPTAFAANVAATKIVQAGIPSAGSYEVKVSLLKTAAGTAGTASFNVNGTDAVGAYTLPVCTLDVVAGVRASGSVIVRSTGAADITLSITGITTPGALAATYEVSIKKLDTQTN